MAEESQNEGRRGHHSLLLVSAATRIDATRQPECSAALYDQRQHRIAPPLHSNWCRWRTNNSLVGATRSSGPDVVEGVRSDLSRTAEATPTWLSSGAA